MGYRPRIRFVVVATLLLAVFAVPAGAQPASIDSLARLPRVLTSAEQSRVTAYAEHWAQQLGEAQEDPAAVRTIRRALLKPLDVAGGPSSDFRDIYSRALVPVLEAVLRDSHSHISVNALIIVSQLRTSSALDVLLDRASARDEERADLRLAASRGCKDLLRGAGLTNFSAKRISGAARKLRDAAKHETNRIVLRHQLEAILAADGARIDPPLNTTQQRLIRSYLVEALKSVGERALEEPDVQKAYELMDAAYPVLGKLRNAFLGTTDQQLQHQLALQLGPCLGLLLEVPLTHWDEAKPIGQIDRRFGKMIRLCEGFLKSADPHVRGAAVPRTNLESAWQAENKEQYEADLQLWQDVLARPPYGD